MAIEIALRSLLINDSAVNALAGARVYPGWLPQNPTMPAVTYTKVSGPRDMALAGATGMAHPRFQVDAWAGSYGGAKDLANAIRRALNGLKNTTVGAVRIGAIVMQSEQDIYEEAVEIHRVSMDFFIWHDET